VDVEVAAPIETSSRPLSEQAEGVPIEVLAVRLSERGGMMLRLVVADADKPILLTDEPSSLDLENTCFSQEDMVDCKSRPVQNLGIVALGGKIGDWEDNTPFVAHKLVGWDEELGLEAEMTVREKHSCDCRDVKTWD
jgi:hypothetical protein